LYGDFGKYYGDWMAGEALQNAGFYAKPLFPHGPNMLQTAAIAASMTGNVWIAVAVSATTSGLQVADGTMSWKQAAFQVGMSAATAALGAGANKLGGMASAAAGGSKIIGAAATSSVSAVGNTLLSSVTLEGGHIGVDEDKLKSWKTWTGTAITAAAGTAANGYMTSDFSKAAVNGVGAGLTSGVTTGDWKGGMIDGVRGAAAGYLAGKVGGAFSSATGLGSGAIINLANSGLNNMMGGDSKFSWDMVAQNNAIGDMVGGYLNGALMSPELKEQKDKDEKAAAEDQRKKMEGKDFMERMDVAIGGIYLSMKDDMLDFGSDMSRAAGDIGKGLSYAANMAGDFAERTGNWVSDGLFGPNETAADLEMTDADYAEWKQYQKEQAALGIDVQYSKTKIQIDESEQKTRFESIMIAHSSSYPIDQLNYDIDVLLNTDNPIVSLVQIVPEFTPKG